MEAKPILIVDDEKNIRMTLSQALKTQGFQTDTAMNGEEALAKLAAGGFGLILLDLKMPGMDGMEVLRRVRQTRPDVKVIIITAHGTIESAVEAMKLGAVDFIQKPFAPAEIRELVQRVLDRDKLRSGQTVDYASHVEMAKKRIGERNFDAAREQVRLAIAADPTRPEGFNLLGVLQELAGDKPEAQKSYRAALALDPTYRSAEENLSRTVGPEHGGGISLGETGKR